MLPKLLVSCIPVVFDKDTKKTALFVRGDTTVLPGDTEYVIKSPTRNGFEASVINLFVLDTAVLPLNVTAVGAAIVTVGLVR